jgi:internalin A
MKCKKCGQIIPEGSKFCTKCGTPVKKSNVKLFVIVALIVLALVVGAASTVALLTKGKKKKAASGTDSSEPKYTVKISWKSAHKEDHPMDFETEEAEKAVYDAIEKTYGKVDRDKELMLSDCYELTELWCYGVNSQEDFEKICEIENLQDLTFQQSDVMDISAVANLKYLALLSFDWNHLEDISALAGLTELRYLDLTNSNIQDYTPLASLQNLTTLDLDLAGTPVDTEVLAQLTKMKYIYLDGAELQDIEFARGYSDLVEMTINKNNVSDISPLKDKDKLTRFECDFNHVSDISALKGKPDMYSVSFNYNNVTDISPLKGYDLVRLNAAYNDIKDISVVKDMVNMDFLDLSGNGLTDIKSLGNFDHPHEIYLHDNNISDVSPLIHYSSLATLDLGYNNLEGDLSIFGDEMTNLRTLDIGGEQLSSFEGIEGFEKIETLKVTDKHIDDFDVLDESETLRNIHCSQDFYDRHGEKYEEYELLNWSYNTRRDVFIVNLTEVGPNEVKVIDAIHDNTELSLSESKDVVEAAPGTIVELYSYREMLDLKAALEDVGAVVDVVLNY